MQFVVTPRFVPILKMDLPAGSRHHTGGQSESTAKGKSYDYAGNREYRVGDNIGHIDWSATARLRTTIVREYRDEYFNRVGIILDTHTVEPTRIVSTNEFESAVSLTAAISDYITKNDYQTEVFCTEDAFVEPAGLSRFGKHAEIMMALANTEPTHVSSVERIVPKLQDRTGNVSVWLIVLLDWTEERSAFVNQLSATGAFVKVYVVRNCVPTDPYPSSETYRPLSILTPQDVMSGLIE